jgi:hypothetical protein
VVHREPNVRHAEALEPRHRIGSGFREVLELLGIELAEPLLGDGREERGARRKVMVRRAVRDARATSRNVKRDTSPSSASLIAAAIRVRRRSPW